MVLSYATFAPIFAFVVLLVVYALGIWTGVLFAKARQHAVFDRAHKEVQALAHEMRRGDA